MDFIPPPPTSPQLDNDLGGGVPVPLPPSPTIWQDISATSSFPDLPRPPSPPQTQPRLPPIIVEHPAPPTCVILEPARGRSRSRSPFYSPRGYSPIYVGGGPGIGEYATRMASRRFSCISPSRSSRSASRSPSRSPCRCPRRRRSFRSRSMTPSPERRYSFHPQPIPVPPPPPIIFPPPPPPQTYYIPPASPLPVPPQIIPSCMSPPPPVSPLPVGPPYEPVDIVTFSYNKDMAYAPAAKTYDEAIDTVLELWPELHSFDRDRISLLVGGSDQLVRVPKVAWRIVLGDLPRYEVLHIHVDQQPPPPQYQGDEKKGKGDGKRADEDGIKGRPSRGLFSSIKRIFGR